MRSTRKKTRYLTYGAVLIALGVVVLLLGSFIQTIDLTVAALASFFCVYAVIEMGGWYPWAVWLGTSFLAFLLLPQKSPALFYLFIGFYPMVKQKAESLHSRVAAWGIKLLDFHAAAAGCYFGSFLFLSEDTVAGLKWELLALYGIGLAAFILFDLAMTRLITLYLYRLHDRFGIK